MGFVVFTGCDVNEKYREYELVSWSDSLTRFRLRIERRGHFSISYEGTGQENRGQGERKV